MLVQPEGLIELEACLIRSRNARFVGYQVFNAVTGQIFDAGFKTCRHDHSFTQQFSFLSFSYILHTKYIARTAS